MDVVLVILKQITNKYFYIGKIIEEKWNDLLNTVGKFKITFIKI